MVQVIPKEFIKSKPTLVSVLPWIGLFLLIIVVATYFILGGQIGNAKTDLKKVKADLSRFETAEQKARENRIIIYKRKIDDVVRLLEQHQKPTEFMVFLEKFVHPNVYFSSFSLDLATGKAIMGGVAKDFKSLGQQIFIFELQPFIQRAKLANISLVEGTGIKFNLELFLVVKDSKTLNQEQ